MTKKKVGKRQRPKVSQVHEELSVTDVWRFDGYIEKVCFTGGTLEGSEDERLSFDDVHFKEVSFSSSELRAVEFVDVVFQNCDFSNVHFQNAFFHRCEFVNSKLTGADFGNSKVSHTLFDDCEG
ncbi:pentapeptide repeat-containing protein, partial [Microvirga sp. 3-52]|nr:pentapeptide repeat-containing protein [Microvirga sp. 3-52]